MRSTLLLILLVASSAPAQVYEWTDKQGDVHYTNDVSTIPQGVAKKPVRGGDIVISHDVSAPPGRPDAGAAPRPLVEESSVVVEQPEGPSRCAKLQAKLVDLAAEISTARAAAEAALEHGHDDCLRILNVAGKGRYAQCMASPSRRDAKLDRAVKDLEAEESDAREDLRREKLLGCGQ